MCDNLACNCTECSLGFQIDGQSRAQQLADAFELVAKCDHYMVGIVGTYTDDELTNAEQILIDRDNSEDNKNQQLNLALDLVEHEKHIRR